jgi:methionine-rich copper-binding protein CopC
MRGGIDMGIETDIDTADIGTNRVIISSGGSWGGAKVHPKRVVVSGNQTEATMSRSRFSVAMLAILTVCLAGSAANAHATLTSSNPQANASAASPKEIRLSFSEGVVAKFSGVELKDETGKAVETGTATADPKDSKQLVIPLSTPLAAGRYTVNWHAVSEDTHRIKGEYSFTVTH